MDIGVKDWLLAFSGIILIRFLIEAISDPRTSGIISSDPQALIHGLLFYLVATVGSMLIIDYFTKQGIKTANFMIFFLCFMWVAPVLDFILSKGKGFQLAYISDSGLNLVRDFFTFGGPTLYRGATLGIRFELALIFFGLSWFVWQKTKNLKKSIATFVISYVFVFIISALPGIIYTSSSIISGVSMAQNGTPGYITNLISGSNISFNSVRASLIPYSRNEFLEIGFDKLMSQFYFIILSGLLFLWFWRNKKNTLVAILKNSRPERAGHYIILVLLGIWSGYVAGFGRISSWVDTLGIICLVISWYTMWIFSVNLNDLEDLTIDRISNKNRPLVQNTVTEKEMSQSVLIFLCISLLGSWSAGYYPFFMSLVCISASYIYSVSPLRLKLVPIISTFLMALASLASILAGFFFISQNKIFYSFSPLAMFGILVCYTLLFNVKDLKDVEGDRAEDCYTIPVIFGEKRGQKIIGIMFALSFLLLPIFFSDAVLFVLSIPASVIGYILITKYPRKEKSFFILYFVYILLGVILHFPL